MEFFVYLIIAIFAILVIGFVIIVCNVIKKFIKEVKIFKDRIDKK